MSYAISQYDALWQSIRIRRSTLERPVGLDATAARWYMRMRNRKNNVARWRELAERVELLNGEFGALSDGELDARTAGLREVFRRRKNKEGDLIAGLAAIRELAFRVLGQKPYVVQLMGALAMYHGQVVEMVTGEGKTLTATMPAILLAWSLPNVHVITANDYLAGRDAATMGPLYARAGLSCGAVLSTDETAKRAGVYRDSIIYTTQKELVADWLRDHIRMGPGKNAVTERLTGDLFKTRAPVLIPGLHAVIIDEADAILIDQAVTPLIIATARSDNPNAHIYARASALADQMRVEHYKSDSRARRVKLNEEGKRHLATLLKAEDKGPWLSLRRRHELVDHALTARVFYVRGVQYEIVEDRVVMIDEFTGRFQPDRHWQHGIHQSVEAKEGKPITGDGRSLASLSFQRFFRLYPFLAGMTGTAASAKAELEETYQVPVCAIPTNKELRRSALPDCCFATSEERWKAVAESVLKFHQVGRPVLIGTRSVAASQAIAELLTRMQLPHEVLNAINHEREASIISMAGQRGAITVATNMAGRGTDILLGQGVAELGGLHVILTERHEALRVDRQLIGRAGRQGDPGSSQIFYALDDELIVRHATRGLTRLARAAARKSADASLAHWVSRRAQRRAERLAFEQRKSILKRDDWLDELVPGS